MERLKGWVSKEQTMQMTGKEFAKLLGFEEEDLGKIKIFSPFVSFDRDVLVYPNQVIQIVVTHTKELP